MKLQFDYYLIYRQLFLHQYHSAKSLVVLGQDGIGKTTQIPQWVLFDEYPGMGSLQIACIQPNCEAAISVAEQVAAELDVEVGDLVGYSTLFQEKVQGSTKLKFMSDKAFCREMKNMFNLRKYSCIVVDEAQERTLWTDVLLSCLNHWVITFLPKVILI